MARPLRVVLGEWQKDDAFRRAITTPVEFVVAPTLRDEDVAPLLHGADVLLSRAFTPGMTAAADSLRLIHTPGAGTNWIEFDAIPNHIAVCNVFGHEISITEYVFMAILALNRDLRNMDARFRAGDWSDRKSRPPGTEIRGQTLLVLGLGHIGAEVARVGRAFGMRVIGVTRNAGPERAIAAGVDECRSFEQLVEVLPHADFVVVAVPLDAATTGLIGERELAAMTQTGFLINVARGEVVAEEPLFFALRNRRIGGAAIDVWYRYPDGAESLYPSAFPFHELDNVLMTPHIAGWTRETFQHRWVAIDENLRRLSAGEPLLNVVKVAAR